MPRLLATILGLLLGGCTNVAYYAQAVEGQMRLMAATRPISELVIDTGTDSGLRRQLEQATAIREFAIRELDLPDNGSYRSYADLGRPYVVWNVFAAPEFSVEPQQWCLAFIGCVNYRGYYHQEDAERLAGELGQGGHDTHVGGVPAYSTLGHFDDPVLNTFLRLGEREVARVIFHELAHQIVYAKGDTAFNEAFATTVEAEGMRRWLRQAKPPEQWQAYAAQQQRKAQFHQLVADSREKLRAIYASPLLPDAKRRAKTEAIAAMKLDYARLKASWGGYGGYDPWFSQPLNNAVLGSVALYAHWVPAFQALLEQESGSLPRFYQRVAALARVPRDEREAALTRILPTRTATPAIATGAAS
jgi:predicted aminopeptidase